MEHSELKSLLQSKLEEHFNKFHEVTINNINLKVMPASKDIPRIVAANYKNDVLEIYFSEASQILKEVTITNDISIYLGTSLEMVGIKVNNFTDIFIQELRTSFEEWILANENKANAISPMKKEIELRKINFFEEVFRNPNNLVYA